MQLDWLLPRPANTSQEALYRENQLLRAEIQELLTLDETGFFIELDSLLRAILKKALILCKADASFFALTTGDPPRLDVRISNLVTQERMDALTTSFLSEYQRWLETESEILPIEDFILLPLIRRHKMLGIIGLKLNANAPENVCEILPVLARQAAASLESAILYDRMFKRLLVLSNVFVLGKEIVGNIDLGTLMRKFLEVARDGTGCEVGAVYLIKEGQPHAFIHKVLAAGVEANLAEGERPPLTPIMARVLSENRPTITNDLSVGEGLAERDKIAGVTLRHVLTMPLKCRDKTLGLIQMANKQAGREGFGTEDIDLLNILSSQIAFVIQNADLFKSIQDAYINTLEALSSAIDAKDPYTHGHSDRVTQLSVALAREIRLDPGRIEKLRIAALLHDVGKIGIPEQILNKPGRLTDEEFQVIKSHPDTGVMILAKVHFLDDLIPDIRHHHERYDGKGYPAGLAGDAIPLGARVIAVADTYDAMTSNRPYRQAMPKDVAIREILRCKGTQFDPEIAEAFVKMSNRHDAVMPL